MSRRARYGRRLALVLALAPALSGAALGPVRLRLAMVGLVVIGLAGCAVSVSPPASRIADRLAGGAPPAEVMRDLSARGFVPRDPARSGGPFPERAPCIEKARGGALTGVDVVRVCAGPGGAYVYGMQTHSPRPWQQYWPRPAGAGEGEG